MNKNFNKESDEFWADIIENKDGSLNKEQIYKELRDYYFLMKQVPEVYCAITNNALSYTTYSAKTVISVYEDCLGKEIETAIEDEKEIWNDEHNEIVDKLKEENEFLTSYIESLTKCVARNEVED